MAPDLILRNCSAVVGGALVTADIGVTGEVVSAVGEPGSLGRSTQELDVEGRYVVPGGVDPHVHTATELGEFTTLDGFEESTRAAAWGGTTTLVDFAIPQPRSRSSLACAHERQDLARGAASVDVAFHACLVSGDPRSLGEIPELAREGLTTVKVFTIYQDTVMLRLDEVYDCLCAVAEVGGLVLVHAESPHLVEPLRERFHRAGSLDARHHALSRPPAAEVDMVRSVLELFRLTRCAGYFVHVTVPEAAAEIWRARESGVAVWAETCPHYVFLDDSRYDGPDGDLYVCSPPLRPRPVADELWTMVRSGAVDVWGSDHCCYDTEQKRRHRGDFTRAPNGLPGVELRAPLLFSEGVMTGALSLPRFAELTAANPARLNGLFPRKGVIAPGADADLAVYDPEVEVEVTPSLLHMPTDYTPFAGMRVRGWPRTVLSRGRIVVDGDRFLGERGGGRVLAAARPVPL